MRTRAAAALHKVLTFQDVRTRVGDIAPSTVTPLVRLLRQDGSSEEKKRQAARDREHAAAARRSPEEVSELRHVRVRREGGQSKEPSRGGWVGEGGEVAEAVGRPGGSKVTSRPRYH